MLKKIYLSPIGYIISAVLNFFSILTQPFMVYGYYNRVQKKFFRNIRISSDVKILVKQNLNISDNCWIGAHCLIDASGGLTIEEGVQISSLNAILTHSSHIAIRLLGKDFLATNLNNRLGYIASPVRIGRYSFIGSGAIILPGTNIGAGCIIGAGSVVIGNIPDYTIAVGNPAKIIGKIDKLDRQYMKNININHTYFDKEYLDILKKSLTKT